MSPAGTEPPRRVAIVDSDPEVVEQLARGLAAAGFAVLRIELQDFPEGRAALAYLREQGADAVVYDIGGRYEQNRERFHQFSAAAVEEEVPMVVSSGRRWTHEAESAPVPGPPWDPWWWVDRVARAIARELQPQGKIPRP